MLEYVLFAPELRDRFMSWLDEYGIDYRTAAKGDELLVLIDEDIAEELLDAIDEQYDLLLDESMRLADAEDATPDALHMVGIQFQCRDGRIGQVRISPELANRLHRCLDMVELQAFVQSVVDAAQEPDDGPLCKG